MLLSHGKKFHDLFAPIHTKLNLQRAQNHQLNERHPFAGTSRAVRASVLATALPRAGLEPELPLKLKDFIDTVPHLTFAKDNGCPWEERTLRAMLTSRDPLEVIKWALSEEQNCPWDDRTLEWAVHLGHWDVFDHIKEKFPKTFSYFNGKASYSQEDASFMKLLEGNIT